MWSRIGTPLRYLTGTRSEWSVLSFVDFAFRSASVGVSKAPHSAPPRIHTEIILVLERVRRGHYPLAASGEGGNDVSRRGRRRERPLRGGFLLCGVRMATGPFLYRLYL